MCGGFQSRAEFPRDRTSSYSLSAIIAPIVDTSLEEFFTSIIRLRCASCAAVDVVPTTASTRNELLQLRNVSAPASSLEALPVLFLPDSCLKVLLPVRPSLPKIAQRIAGGAFLSAHPSERLGDLG